jgi:hypothetical protein
LLSNDVNDEKCDATGDAMNLPAGRQESKAGIIIRPAVI